MNNKNSIGCIIRIHNEYSKQHNVDDGGGNHETIPLYFKVGKFEMMSRDF